VREILFFTAGQIALDPGHSQVWRADRRADHARAGKTSRPFLKQRNGLAKAVKTTSSAQDFTILAAMNAVYGKYLRPEVLRRRRGHGGSLPLPKDVLVEIDVVAEV